MKKNWCVFSWQEIFIYWAEAGVLFTRHHGAAFHAARPWPGSCDWKVCFEIASNDLYFKVIWSCDLLFMETTLKLWNLNVCMLFGISSYIQTMEFETSETVGFNLHIGDIHLISHGLTVRSLGILLLIALDETVFHLFRSLDSKIVNFT